MAKAPKKSKSKPKGRARKRKCERKTVCRAVGAKPAPSAKQLAWRRKFAQAALDCRQNHGDYGKCMEKALK
jgi:hypothetical protein